MTLRRFQVETVTFAGRNYELDDFGFLKSPDHWDEDFADGMADKLGIVGGLSDRHWRVINHLRDRFEDENTVPFFVVACMETGLRIQEFRDLFPTGYLRGACRLAGLSYEFMATTNFALTYESQPMQANKYELTELGFLKDFNAWREEFALMVAHQWGGKVLTDRHRQVIGFLREHFAEHKTVPLVFETCRALSMSIEELGQLFPGGYRRGACRMAGLPLLP